MKQAIIVRTDLKMGKGKIAAQSCHACLGAYKKANKIDVRKWELSGGKKVVLKVSSEETLEEFKTELWDAKTNADLDKVKDLEMRIHNLEYLISECTGWIEDDTSYINN